MKTARPGLFSVLALAAATTLPADVSWGTVVFSTTGATGGLQQTTPQREWAEDLTLAGSPGEVIDAITVTVSRTSTNPFVGLLRVSVYEYVSGTQIGPLLVSGFAPVAAVPGAQPVRVDLANVAPASGTVWISYFLDGTGNAGTIMTASAPAIGSTTSAIAYRPLGTGDWIYQTGATFLPVLQVEAIPSPAAAALLSLACIAAARRRRA